MFQIKYYLFSLATINKLFYAVISCILQGNRYAFCP